MASERNQKVHSGNTVEIIMKGKRVGRASNVTSNDTFGTEGQYEIGSIMPQEHIALRYEGRVTVNVAYLRTKPLRALGLAINAGLYMERAPMNSRWLREVRESWDS